jgi:undecaprenyl-diphosphatase
MRRGLDSRLVAGVAAGIGFVALGLLVGTGWPALMELDVALDGGLHRFGAGHPAWVTAMWWLTQLGSFWVVCVVTAIAAVTCVWSGRFRAAALCVTVALLISPATELIKGLTERPRPADHFWTATGYAFPSGHASNATAAAAIVLIACWPLVRDRPLGARIVLVGAVATLPLTIGLTRLAGGVHWPSDVLGGWLLTIAVIALLAAISDRVVARSSR